MIPKIIWQTHEWEYEDLPIYFAKTSMTWINLNPEYRYVYVSGAEREKFIKLEYPEFYTYYKYMGNKDKRFESDIWRYLVISKRGGFYCDMDSICIKPLNYLLKDFKDNHQTVTLNPNEMSSSVNYIAYNDYSHLNIDSAIITNNSNFGAIPKSTFFKGLIKRMQTDGEGISFGKEPHQFYLNEKLQQKIFTPWDIFNLELSKNLDTNLTDDFAHHSGDFKKDFINIHKVDYYGEKVPYLEILKKEGLKEYYLNHSLKEVKRLTLNRKKEYARIFN